MNIIIGTAAIKVKQKKAVRHKLLDVSNGDSDRMAPGTVPTRTCFSIFMSVRLDLLGKKCLVVGGRLSLDFASLDPEGSRDENPEGRDEGSEGLRSCFARLVLLLRLNLGFSDPFWSLILAVIT